MNSKSHNKKRNSGLLYEFLVSTISRALVEGDKKLANSCLRMIKRHFKPGTELYKEFRLINSLRKTHVSSESVASHIMAEARKAARTHDSITLDRQKSLLIKEINHTLKNEHFYDQQVDDYKTLATLQSLMNDWRSKNPDLSRLARYEDQLMKHLTEVHEPVNDDSSSQQLESPGESRFMMKIMMKKLNEKYSGSLNDAQKSLLRAYAFSTATDDNTSIKIKLSEIKDGLLASIKDHSSTLDESVRQKLNEVKSRILSEQLNEVNDDTVTRFMLYAKLNNELTSDGDSDV